MDEDLERTVQALSPHVQEMRRRLLQVLLFFFIATGIAFYWSADLLTWLQQDLALALNALAAYEVLYTQLIIAALAGFVLTLPFTTFHLLRFLKPGLKPREYRVLRNYAPFFFVLFFAGAAFSYEFVVKTSLQFFQQSTAASDVAAVWGLKSTILFVLKISALTGVMFQLPIIAAILSRAGMLRAAQMKQYRAYVIVSVLLIAAVATPPDVITQILVTVPVIGLYEVSILLVTRIEGHGRRNAA